MKQIADYETESFPCPMGALVGVQFSLGRLVSTPSLFVH